MLSLNIKEPNGSARVQSRKRPGQKFDVDKWRQYASYLSEADSMALVRLRGVSEGLTSGNISSNRQSILSEKCYREF